MNRILLLLLVPACLLLSSCLSTAIGLTAGTVKVAATAVTLPVKATAKVAGAVLDDDCEEDPRECKGEQE